MGVASSFRPERLIVALLSSPLAGQPERDRLERELSSRFGPFVRGPSFPFDWSPYYDDEMGGRPLRGFAAFERSVDPSTLAEIKMQTNEVESLLSRPGGGRLFNLDPGLLSLSRFVLATTKERPHRLPLGRGIYGELTLLFDKGDYRPLPWTYPDWASEGYRSYLRMLRASLKSELRSQMRFK
jgi:hypothetical protein